MKMYSVMYEWVSWKEPPFQRSQKGKCHLRYIYEKCKHLWNAFLQAHFSISPEKRRENKETKQNHLHGNFVMYKLYCHIHNTA